MNLDTPQSFCGEPVQYEGLELPVGLSIGIATFPGHGDNMDDVFRAADSALYQAKQEGRNCIRIWQGR